MSSNEKKLLEVKQINKEFPGVKALDGVDLTLRRGEVQALIGENGAGKSTLIKILAGIYTRDSGEILFEGKAAEIYTASDSLRLGIKVVFQELALVPQLSVAENVFLESFPLNFRIIDEYVFPPCIPGDDSITFLLVEPFDGSEFAVFHCLKTRFLILPSPGTRIVATRLGPAS